ncbi:transposase [Azomonas macrocytogenes]|uniref:Transposase IS4-like domain-containing protein n=1 Tax=Azomonas macrocytogenes TaxID=69962 RepID=A0A839TBG4_AZOMA|nr:hypothetical protein [Azomonas macrocytogenes]
MPGQVADITQATPLMAGIDTSALLADRGYDANRLLAWLKEHQIQAVGIVSSNALRLASRQGAARDRVPVRQA